MEEFDVVVVGAGPTGLMMASELLRYGLTCKIVDRREGPSCKSKALAIQSRTLEILNSIGLGDQFLSRGLKLFGMHLYDGYSKLGSVDLKYIESQYPFILSLPQSETETILGDHLRCLGGSVDRGWEVTEIVEERGGYVVKLNASEVRETRVKAKWVVGCDGAHSFVRHHLNLPFVGKALEEVFSLADVKLKWRYPRDRVTAVLSKRGPLLAIPLPQDEMYRIIFQLDRCQRSMKEGDDTEDNIHVNLPPPTFEECRGVVSELGDPNAVISDPIWLANFHVNSRLTKSYRVGDLFLLGDAAHIHSPIGGQGMNTGLQDAFNLAWKLAMVRRGVASEAVLDSFNSERHGVAKNLLKGTERGTEVLNFKSGWKIAIRNFFASKFLHMHSVQKELTAKLSQVGIRYPKSEWFREKGEFRGGPKAGQRMPDGPCELHKLLKGTTDFTLFIFADEGAFTIEPSDFSLPIKVHTISDPGARAYFGVKSTGAYLVRPDHYIAYRQTPIKIEALKAFASRFSPCEKPQRGI